MKKLVLIFTFLITIQFGYSQVGINTTAPSAQLDIKSSNQATPANNDGILIPKIDAFPVTNPTAAQNSMMVYLTTTSAGKQPGFYYWDNATTSWKGFGGSTGWDLLGNSGTNATTNFIGTTDNVDLVFRRNNVISGKIGMATTSFGRNSLNPLSSGIYNSSFGLNSLSSNTNGNSNSAFGNYALNNNTSGNSNSAFGNNALYTNTSGLSNTAIGSDALEYNTQGNNNSAIGYYSLYNNTLGGNNTANGFEAMHENLTGGFNTAIGSRAFYSSKSGSVNTAVGDDALSKSDGADLNVAVGGSSMLENLSGSYNTAVGSGSLRNSTNTNGNTAIGYESLYISTGLNNTALGFNSGNLISTGSNNIAIGNAANVPSPTSNDQMSIGNVIYGSLMNTTTSGKIGIGETTPNAKLQINASNQASPANTDGILIPKIDAFPLTNPTAAQNSMMVYLTTTSVGKLPGYYYWHQPTLSWKKFSIDGEGNPKYYTVVGTTDIVATASTTPMAEMTQTFTPNSTVILVQFGAAGYNAPTACGQNPVYFTIILDGVPVKTVQSSMEDININNRPIWDTNIIYPLTVVQGVPHTVSINWFTSCPTPNGVLNNALTPATTGNYQAYRSLTITDPNGGGGIVGTSPVVTNDSWSTIGNLGTNPTTNFIGTLDNNDVVFKRNNILIGKLSASNVTFGFNAGLNNTGVSNIAIGSGALQANTAGTGAVAIGQNALFYSNNSTTTFTNHSVAVGFEALRGYSSTNTANNNTAIGYQSGRINYNATDNTAVGNETLFGNYNGSNNVAIGASALHTQNFFNGGTAFDSDNVAIGYNALFSNNPTVATNGIQNVGVGSNTIKDNTTGNENSALGYNALTNNTTGTSNVAIGSSTLIGNTTGSSNIAIGANANVLTLNASNQLSIGNAIYGSNINNATSTPANIALNTTPSIKYSFYNYMQQQTVNADGQYSSYSYRTRNSQNDGISYAIGDTNAANTGYNFWGDVYTFGTTGYSYNDYTRTGGVLGSNTGGTYWSSLGYKSSASLNYGIYSSAAGYAQGAGRISQSQTEFSIGGGFYGGLIGSWSRGNIIGQINSGTLLASYNNGDEYTSGKQIELVTTGTSKTAAYTVTSTESVVYKKGKITLSNGTARVNFDENYKNLLGEIPVVTTTPMGQCSGIYIESVDKNGFTIKELNNGTSNVNVSWIAVGDRIDVNTTSIPSSVLTKDFDSNLNDVMFNENNLNDSAKAMWSNGNKINFGKLPENLIDKPVKTEEKNNK